MGAPCPAGLDSGPKVAACRDARFDVSAARLEPFGSRSLTLSHLEDGLADATSPRVGSMSRREVAVALLAAAVGGSRPTTDPGRS